MVKSSNYSWWYTYPEKYELYRSWDYYSQLIWKHKHVPNHQPDRLYRRSLRLLAHWQLLEFRHNAIFGPESLATDHCNHGLWMFMVDISTDS